MNPLEAHINNLLREEKRYPKLVAMAKAVNKCDDETAQAIVETEISFFGQKAAPVWDKNQSISATDQNLINLFSDVLINRLSFSPSLNHVYILPSFQNLNLLSYALTPYGEVYLRIEAKSIACVTKPVIVREGDTITYATINNEEVVTHTPLIHGNMDKLPPITSAYCFVILPNGMKLLSKMTFAQFMKLKGNRKNALYGDMTGETTDEAFFAGKLIKHAVKPFAKKRIISTLLVEENETDTEQEVNF